jgi:hypothetical protein
LGTQIPLLPPSWQLWDWTKSSGNATSAETREVYEAIASKGLGGDFSRATWNELVEVLSEALSFVKIPWDSRYGTAESSKMQDSDNNLSANAFNAVAYNIYQFGFFQWKLAYYIEQDPSYSTNQINIKYNEYLDILINKINVLISILNEEIYKYLNASATSDSYYKAELNKAEKLKVLAQLCSQSKIKSNIGIIEKKNFKHLDSSHTYLDAISNIIIPISIDAKANNLSISNSNTNLIDSNIITSLNNSKSIIESELIAKYFTRIEIDNIIKSYSDSSIVAQPLVNINNKDIITSYVDADIMIQSLVNFGNLDKINSYTDSKVINISLAKMYINDLTKSYANSKMNYSSVISIPLLKSNSNSLSNSNTASIIVHPIPLTQVKSIGLSNSKIFNTEVIPITSNIISKDYINSKIFNIATLNLSSFDGYIQDYINTKLNYSILVSLPLLNIKSNSYSNSNLVYSTILPNSASVIANSYSGSRVNCAELINFNKSDKINSYSGSKLNNSALLLVNAATNNISNSFAKITPAEILLFNANSNSNSIAGSELLYSVPYPLEAATANKSYNDAKFTLIPPLVINGNNNYGKSFSSGNFILKPSFVIKANSKEESKTKVEAKQIIAQPISPLTQSNFSTFVEIKEIDSDSLKILSSNKSYGYSILELDEKIKTWWDPVQTGTNLYIKSVYSAISSNDNIYIGNKYIEPVQKDSDLYIKSALYVSQIGSSIDLGIISSDVIQEDSNLYIKKVNITSLNNNNLDFGKIVYYEPEQNGDNLYIKSMSSIGETIIQ